MNHPGSCRRSSCTPRPRRTASGRTDEGTLSSRVPTSQEERMGLYGEVSNGSAYGRTRKHGLLLASGGIRSQESQGSMPETMPRLRCGPSNLDRQVSSSLESCRWGVAGVVSSRERMPNGTRQRGRPRGLVSMRAQRALALPRSGHVLCSLGAFHAACNSSLILGPRSRGSRSRRRVPRSPSSRRSCCFLW